MCHYARNGKNDWGSVMDTPIVDFVKKYVDSNTLRLHMPGHKGNGFLGVEKLDITEIDGADVLYSSNGIITKSQLNASKLFETKNTFYSTEGSSLCIRAMLYLVKSYALQNGKKPLIAAGRNAHKTFVTTCALLNIDVDWLLPDNIQTVVSCVITADFLDKYLYNIEQKPTAIYITSPDYLGNMTNIAALSDVCKKYGVLLVVDNAHGAYLKFLTEDIHPITQGADMCCDSAHKTLPVLTGGAYLHIGDRALNFLSDNAQNALSLFASTSPSYLILQSLDAVNKYICDGYRDKLSEFIGEINSIKLKLLQKGYCLCGNEPLKITIATKSYGYMGYELSNLLLEKNIVCEFCDPDYIVFMLTPEIYGDIHKLEMALSEIRQRKPIKQIPPTPKLKKSKILLSEVLYAPKAKRSVKSCVGKISASFDAICPPAVPIILPGEEIDADAVQSLEYYGIEEWTVIR